MTDQDEIQSAVEQCFTAEDLDRVAARFAAEWSSQASQLPLHELLHAILAFRRRALNLPDNRPSLDAL